MIIGMTQLPDRRSVRSAALCGAFALIILAAPAADAVGERAVRNLRSSSRVDAAQRGGLGPFVGDYISRYGGISINPDRTARESVWAGEDHLVVSYRVLEAHGDRRHGSVRVRVVRVHAEGYWIDRHPRRGDEGALRFRRRHVYTPSGEGYCAQAIDWQCA